MTTTRRRTNAVGPDAIAQRRSEILERAADLLVASGVTGTTFAAVSEATGFSIGMIQHYFRTRDRLIDACIDHRMAESENRWRVVAAQQVNAVDRLRSLLDFAAEDNVADGWGFWLELFNAARLDDSMRSRINDRLLLWAELFNDRVAEVIDSGAGAPRRPLVDVVQALVALADGLAIQVINGTYGMTPERMRDLLYAFVSDELDITIAATPPRSDSERLLR